MLLEQTPQMSQQRERLGKLRVEAAKVEAAPPRLSLGHRPRRSGGGGGGRRVGGETRGAYPWGWSCSSSPCVVTGRLYPRRFHGALWSELLPLGRGATVTCACFL